MTGAAARGPREDQPKPVAVYVSAGSNVDPAANLRRAVQGLERRFGPLTVSAVYRSKAVGFTGDDFLNAVVGFRTRESAAQVAEALEQIHEEAGRVRGPDPFSPRTLDLDLLLYGQQVIDEPRLRICVPHKDLMRYGFVLGPLAEIAPGLRHPLTGQTMAELWNAFDKDLHPLQRLDVPLK